jgi:hypothetical protein
MDSGIMLDLRRRDECVWDPAMRPIGEGDFNKEPFEDWWLRFGARLTNLEPRIAEQWIFRHWAHSYMAFLELGTITWRLESWTGDRILADAHLEFGGPMDAAHDYQAFNGHKGCDPIRTAQEMNQGTWDMPLLVLETPSGIRGYEGELPDVRYVVAEGSKRMRYLHALRHRGEGAGPHEVFVLTTAQAA